MALCSLRAALACLAFLYMGGVWALDNYHATYDLQIRGIHAGEVRHEAIFTGNTYRIDTFATPTMAAKVLGYGNIRETVTGLLQKGEVRPQQYQRTMEGDAGFALSYAFLPEKQQIDATLAGQNHIIKYQEDVPLDILSMVVQTLADVEQGRLRNRYNLLSDTQVRTYQVEALHAEMWKGKLPAKVFRQVHGDRETRIYLAEQPLRLLALIQIKGGKTRFSLELADYHKR